MFAVGVKKETDASEGAEQPNHNTGVRQEEQVVASTTAAIASLLAVCKMVGEGAEGVSGGVRAQLQRMRPY